MNQDCHLSFVQAQLACRRQMDGIFTIGLDTLSIERIKHLAIASLAV
ncbi:hypothetical protein [Scytonema millei]|uniref:Uncharacterized protein n=1 Tax=Scytonema millei VB511283 TaxID=1245923 RepID=A0A9X5E1S8_9CYAN|nr:hypothetical protein [Scytonema millei]NHC33698.1 hypothetical protein [Scytonema millei VB511283]